MAGKIPNRPASDLDYSKVIFLLMLALVNLCKDSYSTEMDNKKSTANKMRLLVVLMKAYLSPFANDSQYLEAISDSKYIANSNIFKGTDEDIDMCLKHIAANVELAFKYQLVSPYQEEVVDDIDDIRLSYT